MVHNNSHSENVIKMPLYYGFHCFRFQFIKATHQPKDLCLSWYTENISHICDLVPAIIQPFLQPQRVAVTRQSVASQHYLYCLGKLVHLGPVSLRLMTSQFNDIVTHTHKLKTLKCIFCGVWIQNFVWNFKGALWNFTQNFEPIHHKIYILRGVKKLTTYDILELWHLKS